MKSSSIAIMAGVSLGAFALVACGKKDETPATDPAATTAATTTATVVATVVKTNTTATATVTAVRDAGAGGAAGMAAGGAAGAAAGGAGGAKGGAAGAAAGGAPATGAAGAGGAGVARPPGIRIPGKKLTTASRRLLENGSLFLAGRALPFCFPSRERPASRARWEHTSGVICPGDGGADSG